MKLLVAGGDRVDAGKTTFSVGLIEHTGANGYKPRAGSNYWFDHETTERRSVGADSSARTQSDSPQQIRPSGDPNRAMRYIAAGNRVPVVDLASSERPIASSFSIVSGRRS